MVPFRWKLTDLPFRVDCSFFCKYKGRELMTFTLQTCSVTSSGLTRTIWLHHFKDCYLQVPQISSYSLQHMACITKLQEVIPLGINCCKTLLVAILQVLQQLFTFCSFWQKAKFLSNQRKDTRDENIQHEVFVSARQKATNETLVLL